MARERKSEQIIGLDCLRFFAAFIVLMFHLTYIYWRTSDTAGDYLPGIGTMFDFGWVGVQIFFVLSGFVIAYTADSKSAYEFVRSRAMRLYPDAWVCASITLCFVLLVGADPTLKIIVRYLKSITLFPFPSWISGVYWSLRVELAFYFVIFVLLMLDSFRHLEKVMTVIGCASTVFCIVITIVPGWDVLITANAPQLLLLSYGCCFALGTTFWLAMKSGWNTLRVALCVVYTIGTITPTWVRFGGHPAAAVFIASLVFIWLSILYNDVLVKLAGPANLKRIRTIGLITYPMYLVHSTAGIISMRWLIQIGLSKWTALCIVIAAIIAVSYAIVRVAEAPLRRIIGSAISGLLSCCRPALQHRLQRPTLSALSR